MDRAARSHNPRRSRRCWVAARTPQRWRARCSTPFDRSRMQRRLSSMKTKSARKLCSTCRAFSTRIGHGDDEAHSAPFSTRGFPRGPLAISIGGDPDVLIPQLVSTVQAAQMVDLVYERLADIGDSLNVVGDA